MTKNTCKRLTRPFVCIKCARLPTQMGATSYFFDSVSAFLVQQLHSPQIQGLAD